MNTPENTDRDSVESTALFDAVARLQDLAARWNETPEWHNPPFLDGRIHITTGDLRDIATVCREIRASNDQGVPAAAGGTE